jgi:alcohol dehydrogenase, propanol-preferring
MQAMVLREPAPIAERPLTLEDRALPTPSRGEVRLHVLACGVCHTDLHVVEGDLPLPRLPLIPGHQIVGVVDSVGEGSHEHAPGERVGVPWLYATCGVCEHCRAGRENLCVTPQFTGYSVDGGFAEYVTVREDAAYRLPNGFSDSDAAPLLCGGVIGYRSLKVAGVRPGERIGLVGFGSSAHITLQIAAQWGCSVYVFSRGSAHQRLALELGAVWSGPLGGDAPPLDRVIVFAPAGSVVPAALGLLRRGGVLALAGVTMSQLPPLDYASLYWERQIRSVANSTHLDVVELLALAERMTLRTQVASYPLSDANRVLGMLARSELAASAALVP